MLWTRQQTEALQDIEQWIMERDRPFYYLAGYAGTGKSTLAGEIARRMGGSVAYGAFTGRAAAVMRNKGCAGADTIDGLIYKPQVQVSCARLPEPCRQPPCQARRCRHLRQHFVGRKLDLECPVAKSRLCVIDEVSMVGQDMGRDLLSLKTPVLVLGDPAQLPPVGDVGGYFTNNKPDYLLTHIQRQSAGSPVIELATQTRAGQRLRRGTYDDSEVIFDRQVTDGDLTNADQIIVGTHKLRHAINARVRKALGYKNSSIPYCGEKIVCLKNDRELGIRNGTLWIVQAVDDGLFDSGFVGLKIHDIDDPEKTVNVECPLDGFTGMEGSGQELPGQPFAFGYAITCHKAQGSQFDNVLVYDESSVFRRDKWRWLYTAITRAVKTVTVVL